MENIMNINPKKERLKLTPEQLFNLYLECNAPGAPVKPILERYGLRPWDLIAIRKKVKAAAMEALAHSGKLGRRQQVIPAEQYQKVSKELDILRQRVCYAILLGKQAVFHCFQRLQK